MAANYRLICGYQRQLKQNPTASELRFKKVLAEALKAFPRLKIDKKSNLPYKFQKIFRLGNYYCIADFYLPGLKLVFEVDGIQHNEPATKQWDDLKTQLLLKKGIKVVRIENPETLHPLTLQQKIVAIVKNRSDKGKDFNSPPEPALRKRKKNKRRQSKKRLKKSSINATTKPTPIKTILRKKSPQQ